uniref:Uncharacterized protein n=1 Tax=Chaetoceros debilis TaxID=122233 RepID=A0A7S3PUT6_9STRA|mmetsp:Transcript_19968/g.30230  ORF Transcript_19968/g.30230 Transcript_19968/m.30230 type:complete len:156 (+) Transcript_19968:140-607(+)
MKLSIIVILSSVLPFVECLTVGKSRNQIPSPAMSRKKMIVSSMAALTGSVLVPSSEAKYILNDETGDYVEISEEDWQTSWKQRLDKAQSMSSEEIFNAARGAGNLDLRNGEETESGRKRRAMSACRNKDFRTKAGVNDKQCNSRVMGGETDFILN